MNYCCAMGGCPRCVEWDRLRDLMRDERRRALSDAGLTPEDAAEAFKAHRARRRAPRTEPIVERIYETEEAMLSAVAVREAQAHERDVAAKGALFAAYQAPHVVPRTDAERMLCERIDLLSSHVLTITATLNETIACLHKMRVSINGLDARTHPWWRFWRRS